MNAEIIRRAGIGLAAFALGPAALWFAPTILNSRAPAEASAANPTNESSVPDTPISLALSAPTVTLQTDIDIVLALRSVPIARNPFKSSHEREVPEPSEGALQDALPDGVPTLTLGSVIDGPLGAVAIIEGRVVRVGDLIAQEWRVQRIDTDRRSVDIVHDDGRTHSIAMPTRMGERAR